jgi:hypothetical protein
MVQSNSLTREPLKTPRAAAIAGIAFSILLLAIFWLFRSSVPADPLEPGAWLATDAKTAGLALNLIPFAGIAFLWFIGVLRDRLGHLEDRFFATVFLGSALLFLAMLFVAAAVIGALILLATSTVTNELTNSATFHSARAITYVLVNVYAVKMAGAFMISTATILIGTGIAPRWIAILGYALALPLLFGSYYISWSVTVLPLWVLLISVYIIVDNFRHPDTLVSAGPKIASD